MKTSQPPPGRSTDETAASKVTLPDLAALSAGADSGSSDRFAEVFAALGHGARVDILRRLLTVHPTGAVVGELKEELGIPASTLSHHLDALRRVELVVVEREGRFLRYRAGTRTLREVLGFLYAECCSGGLVRPAGPSKTPTAERTGAPTAAASDDDGCC